MRYITNKKLVRKHLEPHVFDHASLKRKIWDFLLVKEYRFHKRREFMQESMGRTRTRFWHFLFDFFTPEPNLPYELWNVKGFFIKLSYKLYLRRDARIRKKRLRHLSKVKNPFSH